MKKLIVITISLALALSLGITVANALTISPPVMEIDAQPGEIINRTIKVVAEIEEEALYYPSVVNFSARGEEGEPAFLEPEETKGYSLADWIEIDSSPFGLKQNERKEIAFTIRVPEGAEPGGHYGVIFFSTQPPTLGEEQTAIGVAGKLGSLILVRVAGDIREEGRLVEFDTENKKGFYNRLPIDFMVRFENTGNVHLKPQGEIKITNLFGKQVAQFLVNENGGNVLPESIRKFKSTWEKKGAALAEGKGFFAELKNEKNNFALGKYAAELSLVGYQPAVKTFWINPWRLLTVYLAIFILVVVLLALLLKLYNQWIISKHKERIKN